MRNIAVKTGSNIVIVGAGAAGHAAASALRKEGYVDRMTLVHPEPHAPYNRTLVNKGVLPGLLTPEQIALPLDSLGIDLVNAAATGVDTEWSTLLLRDGDQVAFDALIVATGSAPRHGVSTASDARGRVFGLHSAEDGTRIRDVVNGMAAPTFTVLGAGFIGAEAASHFAEVGADVHLVSRPTLPLAGVVGEPIARRVADLHHEHVDARFGRKIERIDQGRDSVTVTLDDGMRLESDLVIVAHGNTPVSQWAVGDGGVKVDERLRAICLPAAYAAGGVAVHASTGESYRIDHWDAAAAQGAHAARTLLHDREGAPDPGPYAPTTGFTLNLYRTPIAAYGVALPKAAQRHETAESGGFVTKFHDPNGNLIAVAGIAAGPALADLRGGLSRP
ncbi:MAG TPA: NAD(P)/FAD-dependent oxidoreductase [Glycomyces sp.]|nr:NAD(P)/FAD-dependent oxidoreductase [Glycomyces sp.]